MLIEQILTARGETIHRNYGASRFSGHDSVHVLFLRVSIRFGSLKCKQKCQLTAN